MIQLSPDPQGQAPSTLLFLVFTCQRSASADAGATYKGTANHPGYRRQLLAVISGSPSERPALAWAPRREAPYRAPQTACQSRRFLSRGRHWLAPAAVSHDWEAEARIRMKQRPRQPPISGIVSHISQAATRTLVRVSHTRPQPTLRRQPMLADVGGSAAAFACRLIDLIWEVPPRFQERQGSRQALHSAPASTNLIWECSKQLQEAETSRRSPLQVSCLD